MSPHKECKFEVIIQKRMNVISSVLHILHITHIHAYVYVHILAYIYANIHV